MIGDCGMNVRSGRIRQLGLASVALRQWPIVNNVQGEGTANVSLGGSFFGSDECSIYLMSGCLPLKVSVRKRGNYEGSIDCDGDGQRKEVGFVIGEEWWCIYHSIQQCVIVRDDVGFTHGVTA